jgi:hypothetical protein
MFRPSISTVSGWVFNIVIRVGLSPHRNLQSRIPLRHDRISATVLPRIVPLPNHDTHPLERPFYGTGIPPDWSGDNLSPVVQERGNSREGQNLSPLPQLPSTETVSEDAEVPLARMPEPLRWNREGRDRIRPLEVGPFLQTSPFQPRTGSTTSARGAKRPRYRSMNAINP